MNVVIFKLRRMLMLLICIGLMYPLQAARPNLSSAEASPVTDLKSLVEGNSDELTQTMEPRQAEMRQEWKNKEIITGQEQVQITADRLVNHDTEASVKAESYKGKENVLVWNSNKDSSWIEFQTDIPDEGLYELHITYHVISDTSENARISYQPIVLSMTVDGTYPFMEARALPLFRYFADEKQVRKDDQGDEVRPKPKPIEEWQTQALRDSDGRYTEPLLWHFSKGTHTIRLISPESLAIESIALVPPVQTEAYEPPVQQKNASTETIVIQAEQFDMKNDVAIPLVSEQDPAMTPKANNHIVYNSVGGERWSSGNQALTWTFDVPESGIYKLAMRTYQGFTSNKAVFRTIYIDGKVPFNELLAYRFPYASKWKGSVISSEEGEPYRFYLEKGSHTIQMEATYAPFSPSIERLLDVLSVLREVDYDVKAMTGSKIDRNRTWNAEKDYPDIIERLEIIQNELTEIAKEITKINGKRDTYVQTIQSAVQDLRSISKNRDEIPYHYDDITNLLGKLGNIQSGLSASPLQLDQIYWVPAESSFPKMEAGWWSKSKNRFDEFSYSFVKENQLNDMDENVLNVWVARGRDYVNLLQQYADEYYTPENGMKVKVNLLNDPNMLVLANAANIVPDIALGLSEDKPIDFAIRNAAVDLSQFHDYEETAGAFAPGALLPYYYDKGIYGLPETQSFKVLFYRKDILERLNLTVPDTWDDVISMLPTLQQDNMDFYFPANDFSTFIYQNGADFFTEDGMKSGLDSPEAFQGFKDWTNLYTIYSIEKSVPSFYQHFRDGSMPVGVADYNMYVTMSVAAPELTGRWGIAPLPGKKSEDGTVERWAQGGEQAAVIFKKSDKQQEAWEFMKWWLSADIQEKYGSDLEALNGVQFRWNTSNVEAFARLPWSKEELKVILEQWKWYKGVPQVPGSYFVTRELNNAWYRTVLDGMNYRSSLEQAVMEINRELLRKQQEFGLVDKEGHLLKTLDLPQIDEPWEGVDGIAEK